MTTAKLHIASSTHSTDELSSILAEYTPAPLIAQKQLFGGYSGSSYLVHLQDDSKSTFVLKVSNGYTPEGTEFMCRTAHHLGVLGYKDCCLPIPKRTEFCKDSGSSNNSDDEGDRDQYKFVSLKEQNGVPAFLLSHVEGNQADSVIRDNPLLATAVMRGIGGGLGRMHAASAGIGKTEALRLGLRWYEKDGGCCDVEDQFLGKISTKIMQSSARRHDFVPFYVKELKALRTEMQLVKDGTLAVGITHGDPFADNVLVNPDTGELSSFIDIEDICCGPLLFDLACCAIGCCFKVSSTGDEDEKDSRYPQVLDMSLLAALIDGYWADRRLPEVEKQHFVAFMRLTLLCNCCWRFVKFNVDSAIDNVPEEAKNSYLELKRRIDYLHDVDAVAQIERLLEEKS